jgi:type II secretion system protein H
MTRPLASDGLRRAVRRSSRMPGPRQGFTLIEVVVVLLILGVIASITVPAFLPPRADDELTEATARIEALFRFARDSAARSGIPVVVVIDSSTADAWVYPERQAHDGVGAATSPSRTPPRAPGALQRRDLARGAAGESLELPPGVVLELSQARARFLFRPAGATYGDSVVIRHGAAVRLITIDPWTGHAVVH